MSCAVWSVLNTKHFPNTIQYPANSLMPDPCQIPSTKGFFYLAAKIPLSKDAINVKDSQLINLGGSSLVSRQSVAGVVVAQHAKPPASHVREPGFESCLHLLACFLLMCTLGGSRWQFTNLDLCWPHGRDLNRAPSSCFQPDPPLTTCCVSWQMEDACIRPPPLQ